MHSPSDFVILDLSHTPPAAIADLLEHSVGETLYSGPEHAALKILLLSQVEIYDPGFEEYNQSTFY